MPAIMRLKCNTCEYEQITSQSACYLTFPNGDELILQHPAEELQAFRVTGKHLKELFKEGRIKCKYGLVCTKCGEWDMYSFPEMQSKWGYIGLLVSRIGEKDLGDMPCKFCGNKSLRSVMGTNDGCLLALIKLIAGRKDLFPCPKCKNGFVTFDIVGKS